jgi:hypothetical protein
VNVLSYIQHASFIFIPIPAHLGLTTTVLESIASSIGAGMLTGGFLMATAGFARGRKPQDVEADALRDACLGGAVGVALLILDLATRYIV